MYGHKVILLASLILPTFASPINGLNTVASVQHIPRSDNAALKNEQRNVLERHPIIEAVPFDIRAPLDVGDLAEDHDDGSGAEEALVTDAEDMETKIDVEESSDKRSVRGGARTGGSKRAVRGGARTGGSKRAVRGGARTGGSKRAVRGRPRTGGSRRAVVGGSGGRTGGSRRAVVGGSGGRTGGS